jgi:hypothetical protein
VSHFSYTICYSGFIDQEIPTDKVGARGQEARPDFLEQPDSGSNAMKTAKPRPSGKIPNRPLMRKSGSRKPIDLEEIRLEIAELVGGRAVEMVEITIGEAESGHYAAMKYLFEIIGLYPVTAHAEPSSPDSLAQTLLRRLALQRIPGRKPKLRKTTLRNLRLWGLMP